MKLKRLYFAPILSAFFFVTGCNADENRTVDYRQLEVYQGLAYKVGETEPFTGTMINVPRTVLPEGIAASCSSQLENGVLHGVTSCQTIDGVRYMETFYENDRKHGGEKRWDPNSGTLLLHHHWANDQRSGLQREYHEDS